MSESEYRDWAERCHGPLFAMRSPDDVALFLAWKPLLLAFDFAALCDASRWIASNRAERYRTQHLQLLQERLRQQRLTAMQALYAASVAEAESREARSRCNECNGRGMLTVPHLSQIQDGEWVPAGRTYYESVVCCRCRLGCAKLDRYSAAFGQRPRPPLSIGDYEQHNPHWQHQLEQREKARRLQAAAEQESRHVDRVRGPLAWIQGQAKRLIGHGPGAN